MGITGRLTPASALKWAVDDEIMTIMKIVYFNRFMPYKIRAMNHASLIANAIFVT